MINIFITLTSCTRGGYSCLPGQFYSGIGNFVLDILLKIKKNSGTGTVPRIS